MASNQSNNQEQDIRSIKKNMTLDLDSGGNRSKRLRAAAGGQQHMSNEILSSPDLKAFTLGSPEIEQIIKGSMQASSSQPTPVSVYLYPNKNITDKQAQFVKGFEDALSEVQKRESYPESKGPPLAAPTTLTNLTAANLHNLNIQMGTVSTHNPSTMSSDGIGSDTSDSMTLKDEQTVPLDGAPIDMRDQEKLKLERKRLRNRIAASKCRKKKLERISQLEDQVNKLKNDNQDFEREVLTLRNEVSTLRQQASLHRQHGCLIEL